MIARDIPEAPWQDLIADFFTFKNREYLLVAYAFIEYPFTFKISTKTADTIIHQFTHFFTV